MNWIDDAEGESKRLKQRKETIASKGATLFDDFWD